MTLATKPLGRTGLSVTRLGLGLAALGRPGYINLGHADDLGPDKDIASMRRRCHTMLDCAWQSGIRYFDVARSYGRAEEFLALWLDRRGYRPIVGSKWGYTYTAGWQVNAPVHELKEHTLERLDDQWHRSWRLLGARLDLYQIHSATLESGVLDNAAVLTRLAEIKDAGTRIGLTLSGPNQADVLAKAMDCRLDGKRLFDTVQATWNLLEPTAGEALAAARRNGMGVIIKEALANGRLAARKSVSGLAPLAAIATQLQAPPDAVALAAVLAQPWVDIVLLGAVTEEQLASNLMALDVHLEEDAWQSLMAALAESPLVYWQSRSALAWN